jgi:hypothetical protein
MKTLSFLFASIISIATYADYKDTGNITIKLVSVWANSGDICIQTNPKHDINGLDFGSDYWL